jgi:hypothetical protein
LKTFTVTTTHHRLVLAPAYAMTSLKPHRVSAAFKSDELSKKGVSLGNPQLLRIIL